MWTQALAGIEKHLVTTTKYSHHLRFVAELPHGIGGALLPKMDHLVCFLPGSIALGATGGRSVLEARTDDWSPGREHQIQLARELLKTCYGMSRVTKTKIAPEIVWFEAEKNALPPLPEDRQLPKSSDSPASWKKDYIIKPLDAHNLQRPETVESLFLMWRITGDSIYRNWGWDIFEAMRKHSILDDGEGYSCLEDVDHVPSMRRDEMESFWLVRILWKLPTPSDPCRRLTSP